MKGRRVDDIVDSVGFGFAQWRAILVGGGIFAADGAELLLISSITNALGSDWRLSGTEKGMVVTLVYVGVLVGNALSGQLGDSLGRRLPILSSYLGIVVFSVLSAMTWGAWSLGACRMVVGMAFGLGQPAWNTLGAEISPADSRVMVNAASQVLFAVGETYSGLIIWAEDPALQELNWRRLLVLGSLPSLLFGLAASLWLQESPRFLADQGRLGEAKTALQALARDNGRQLRLPPEWEEVQEEPLRPSPCRSVLSTFSGLWKPLPTPTAPPPPGQQGQASQVHGSAAAAFISASAAPSPSLRKRLRAVWGPQLGLSTAVLCFSTFALNFLYYGSIYAFPQVLPKLKLQLSPGANLVLGALMEVPGYLLAVWLARYTTRRAAIQAYLLSSLLALVSFLHGTGMDASLSVSEEHHPWAVYAGFLGMRAFVNVGFVVIYAYTSEIFPTAARTTGTATCLAAGRLGAMACPLVYEALLEETRSFHHFFLAIGCLTLCNSLLASFLSIETAGKQLSDMDELEPLHKC